MTTRPTTNIERVKLGIKHLNETYPGWLNKIYLERLDINNTYQCVLSQLHGGSYYNSPELENNALWRNDHGFEILVEDEHDHRSYAALTVEWKQQIKELRKLEDLPATS